VAEFNLCDYAICLKRNAVVDLLGSSDLVHMVAQLCNAWQIRLINIEEIHHTLI
jgi:hypothetical protein